MALKKTMTIQTEYGVDIEIVNTYIVVSNINGGKNNLNAEIQWKKDQMGFPVKTEYVSFVPSMDSNFIAQAYLHMKTLAEYADAEDC
jgi:hypothetical protein